MTDEDIIEYTEKLHNKMMIQLQAESHKGVNRYICIIREYGRGFDKKFVDDPGVAQGGFVKLIKKRMLKIAPEGPIKAALKYL